VQSLYEHFGFLPDWAIPSVVALVTIIIGYFFSKILAAIFARLFSIVDKSDERLLIKKVAKLIFWASWAWFIGLGLSQFPLVVSAISKWTSGISDISSIVIILTLSIALFLSEDVLVRIGSKIKAIWIKIPFPKLDGFFLNCLIILGIAIFVGGGSMAVSNPRNISATMFVVSLGVLLSRVIKEVVSSSLDIVGVDTVILSKPSQFSMYFVLSTFLLTAFEIWT